MGVFLLGLLVGCTAGLWSMARWSNNQIVRTGGKITSTKPWPPPPIIDNSDINAKLREIRDRAGRAWPP